MYAIIDISGRQEKLEKGMQFEVNRIEEKKPGDTVKLANVIFGKKDKEYLIGSPYIKGAFVECDVIGHTRGEKIVGLKYAPKKGYKRKVGHRQDLTVLKVKDISL